MIHMADNSTLPWKWLKNYISCPKSWWAHPMMASASRSLVMGSRWLVVPTPVTLSLVRESRSLLAHQIHVCEFAQHLSTLCPGSCQTGVIVESIKKWLNWRYLYLTCYLNKTAQWLKCSYSKAWVCFCIEECFLKLFPSCVGRDSFKNTLAWGCGVWRR